MPRVTIISAYYKRPDAVDVTFRALTNQTYQDWEALVWDDNSPDDTWEVLQKAQADFADPRIKVFQHNPNLGFVAGMNYAITNSQSEFVAVVGSGDAFDPTRIAKQVAAMEADPTAAFCATGAVSIDPDTGETFRDNTFNGDRIEASDLFHSCPFTHGSVLFRREALEAKGLYDTVFIWSADWDLFNRLLKDSHAVHLSEALYERYAREDGASFSPKKSILQIKYAHLVHMLREASPQERDAIRDEVISSGLDFALEKQKDKIISDLCARQAKLYVIGRKEIGDELGALIADQYTLPKKWVIVLKALRAASRLPLFWVYGLAHRVNGLRKSKRST